MTIILIMNIIDQVALQPCRYKNIFILSRKRARDNQEASRPIRAIMYQNLFAYNRGSQCWSSGCSWVTRPLILWQDTPLEVHITCPSPCSHVSFGYPKRCGWFMFISITYTMHMHTGLTYVVIDTITNYDKTMCESSGVTDPFISAPNFWGRL